MRFQSETSDFKFHRRIVDGTSGLMFLSLILTYVLKFTWFNPAPLIIIITGRNKTCKCRMLLVN